MEAPREEELAVQEEALKFMATVSQWAARVAKLGSPTVEVGAAGVRLKCSASQISNCRMVVGFGSLAAAETVAIRTQAPGLCQTRANMTVRRSRDSGCMRGSRRGAA